jgi:predicted transcriptional regulator
MQERSTGDCKKNPLRGLPAEVQTRFVRAVGNRCGEAPQIQTRPFVLACRQRCRRPACDSIKLMRHERFKTLGLETDMTTDKVMLARLTAELVSSYVGNHALSESELDRAIERLPTLIDKVHAALLKILDGNGADGETASAAGPETAEPAPRPATSSGSAVALAPDETVFHDYLICLEDGRKYKTLKRHLSAHYGMTPDEYRAKWNLPQDYPMAAPAYAQARAAIAKNMGLGASGRGGKPSRSKATKRTRPKKPIAAVPAPHPIAPAARPPTGSPRRSRKQPVVG